MSAMVMNQVKMGQTTYWQRAGFPNSEPIDRVSLVCCKIEELRAASSPSSPVCFRCTGKGHFSYQCCKPISCFACNRLGHKAFQCTGITEIQPNTLKATPIETLPHAKPRPQFISDLTYKNLNATKPIRTFHSALGNKNLDELLRMTFLLDAELLGMVKVQRALCQIIPHHDWVVRISKDGVHIDIAIDENCEQTHLPDTQLEAIKDVGSSNGSGSRPPSIFRSIVNKIKESHMGSNGVEEMQTTDAEIQIESRGNNGNTYEFGAHEIKIDKKAKTNQKIDTSEITTSAESMFIEGKIFCTKFQEEVRSENDPPSVVIPTESFNLQDTLRNVKITASQKLALQLLIGGKKRPRKSLQPQVACLNRVKKIRIKRMNEKMAS